jgi:N-carbamoylsarcosine amidase
MRRIGFGERPALINIDLANAWTREGNPFTCDGMDVIIPGVQRLLAAARAKGIPVVYTTTAYAVTDGPHTDMGLWQHKIPVEALRLGTDAVAIDDRISPEPGEQVIVKKFASAFFGTNLAAYLRSAGVDTVIITGVTMAGCVRHTTEDALGHGFRPIVVRECVGDRVAGVVEWNLFDIDAKFGDVESLETVLGYLATIGPVADVPASASLSS